MKKIVVLLLVLAMVGSLLVACKSNKPTPTPDEGSGNADSGTTAPLPEEDPYYYEAPAVNFSKDGKPTELTMLVRSSSLGYHKAYDEPMNVVEQAVFKRNAEMEEKFGFYFTFYDMNGYSSGADDFMQAIRTSVMAGPAYDIVSPAFFGHNLILEGMFQDLASLDEYIDLEKGWWLESYTKETTFNGKAYTVTGDFSVDMLACMLGVFYNKEIYTDVFGDSDLYGDINGLVEDGKWTFETMFQMVQGVSVDLSADNVVTAESNDRIGLIINSQFLKAIPNMSGIHYMDNNNGDVSVNYYSEKLQNVFDLVKTYVNADGESFLGGHNTTVYNKFASGQALFLGHSFEGYNILRDMDDDYGVLVSPKYEEDDEYVTGLAGGTFFAIPTNAKNTEMSAVVLEAMGYGSYYYIRPAFFETTLKFGVARDEDSYYMLDLIRESLYLDFSLAFASTFNIYHDAFATCFTAGENPSVWWQENKDAYAQKIADFKTTISGLK